MGYREGDKVIGQRFGRLVILARAENGKKFARRWECLCDCGTVKAVHESSIKTGGTKSCGCWFRETRGSLNLSHGHSKTAIYMTWTSMKMRCLNPRVRSWVDYGGRGITVCERWVNSFENFLADMGEKPDANSQIDRIDNNGNYEPANCRWVSPAKNGRNKRNNKMLTFNGKTQSQSEWGEEMGIDYHTISDRMTKRGWDTERALTTPVRFKTKAGL